MAYPTSWYLMPIRSVCGLGGIDGALVSNVPVTLAYQTLSSCAWPPSIPDAPPGVVMVGFVALNGGGGIVDRLASKDTPFPLSLSGATKRRVMVRGGTATLDIVSAIQIDGVAHYSLLAWFGEEASANDLRLAEAIVGSIRPPNPPAPAGYRWTLVPGVWALQSVSADGYSITIRVATGDCNKFSHAEVTQTSSTVTVRVFNVGLTAGPGICRLYLKAEEEVVQLFGALGTRKLIGACSPADATAEQRQCASITTFAQHP
jgi:hypothetical protein